MVRTKIQFFLSYDQCQSTISISKSIQITNESFNSTTICLTLRLRKDKETSNFSLDLELKRQGNQLDLTRALGEKKEIITKFQNSKKNAVMPKHLLRRGKKRTSL